MATSLHKIENSKRELEPLSLTLPKSLGISLRFSQTHYVSEAKPALPNKKMSKAFHKHGTASLIRKTYSAKRKTQEER